MTNYRGAQQTDTVYVDVEYITPWSWRWVTPCSWGVESFHGYGDRGSQLDVASSRGYGERVLTDN